MAECRSELPGFSVNREEFFAEEPDLPTFEEWLYEKHLNGIEVDEAVDNFGQCVDLDMMVELVKDYFNADTTEDDVLDYLCDHKDTTDLYIECLDKRGGEGVRFHVGTALEAYLMKQNEEHYYG